MLPGISGDAEDTARQGTVDAQAAIPDPERFQQVLAVVGPAQVASHGRGKDVIEPRPLDAAEKQPDEHVPDDLRVVPAPAGPAPGEIGGRQGTTHDQQAIPADR